MLFCVWVKQFFILPFTDPDVKEDIGWLEKLIVIWTQIYFKIWKNTKEDVIFLINYTEILPMVMK